MKNSLPHHVSSLLTSLIPTPLHVSTHVPAYPIPSGFILLYLVTGKKFWHVRPQTEPYKSYSKQTVVPERNNNNNNKLTT